MNFKKFGKALLFPRVAVMIILLVISTAFLVYSLVFLESESAVAIASYVLAAYTLTVWCMKIPNIARVFREFKNENKFLIRWREDTRLRVNASLYGTLIWNTAYAVMQLGLGIIHRTFWFYSLAGYYICLALMRFFLVRHTSRHEAGERMEDELRKYRACGIVFLVMNLALALIIFFMVYWNRTFIHHEITTITMAAFTFTSLTFAVINIIKFKKLGSPVYMASRIISLASALVSLLTLESTMLTTFSDGSLDMTARRIMLGSSGGAISLFIIAMALYMIIQSTKKLKALGVLKENGK